MSTVAWAMLIFIILCIIVCTYGVIRGEERFLFAIEDTIWLTILGTFIYTIVLKEVI